MTLATQGTHGQHNSPQAVLRIRALEAQRTDRQTDTSGLSLTGSVPTHQQETEGLSNLSGEGEGGEKPQAFCEPSCHLFNGCCDTGLV